MKYLAKFKDPEAAWHFRHGMAKEAARNGLSTTVRVTGSVVQLHSSLLPNLEEMANRIDAPYKLSRKA